MGGFLSLLPAPDVHGAGFLGRRRCKCPLVPSLFLQFLADWWVFFCVLGMAGPSSSLHPASASTEGIRLLIGCDRECTVARPLPGSPTSSGLCSVQRGHSEVCAADSPSASLGPSEATRAISSASELPSVPLVPVTPRGLGEQSAHVQHLLINSGRADTRGWLPLLGVARSQHSCQGLCAAAPGGGGLCLSPHLASVVPTAART